MLSMKKLLFWLALCGAAAAQPVVSSAQLDQLVLPVPDGWYRVQDPTHGDKLVLASDGPADRQALLLITRAPAQNRTLDGVLKAEKTYVVTRMNGVLGTTGRTTVGELPAVQLDYSGASTVAGNGPRDFQRTVIQKGDDFYILQAVAPAGVLSDHSATLQGVYDDLSWSEESLQDAGSEAASMEESAVDSPAPLPEQPAEPGGESVGP